MENGRTLNRIQLKQLYQKSTQEAVQAVDDLDLKALSSTAIQAQPSGAISAIFEILMFIFDKPSSHIKKWDKQQLLAANPAELVGQLKGYDFENINYRLLEKVKLRIDYYRGNKNQRPEWDSEDTVVAALGTYLIKWHLAGECQRQLEPDRLEFAKVSVAATRQQDMHAAYTNTNRAHESSSDDEGMDRAREQKKEQEVEEEEVPSDDDAGIDSAGGSDEEEGPIEENVEYSGVNVVFGKATTKKVAKKGKATKTKKGAKKAAAPSDTASTSTAATTAKTVDNKKAVASTKASKAPAEPAPAEKAATAKADSGPKSVLAYTADDIRRAQEAAKPTLKVVAAADAPINQFEMIELSGLDAACKDAQKAGKYVMLIDRTDKAADYFSYSAQLHSTTWVEFNREVFAVAMGTKTKREACEVLRSNLAQAFVAAADSAEPYRFVIYLDNKIPNFVDEYNYLPDLWPAADIFSYSTYRAGEDYRTIIKPTEGPVTEFNPDFQIIIVATYTNDDQARKLLLNVPKSESMAKLQIV